MKDENNLVRVESEDGKVYNLLILKEFDYKNKKYAVLTEIDSECTCGDECDCGCKGECTCDDDCDCGCKEGKECTCNDNCCCDNESVFILEITKDKKGNEIFKSIDDEKLFNEIVDKADEIIGD